MPRTHTCYRCNEAIPRPVERHAKYVTAPDVVETETVEVAEAVVATEAARKAAERVYGHDADRVLRAVCSDTDTVSYLGVDSTDGLPMPADFDRVEVASVADAPEGTVKVESFVEQREVEKTALVCLDCHDPETDTVIW